MTDMMTLNVDQSRPRSLTGIFNRKRSTYGLVQPYEVEQDLAKLRPKKTSTFHDEMDKDCFVPNELDNWMLPQYQSLFHHLITQDEHGRQRLNSVSSTCSSSKPGPFQVIQRWFKDVVQSFKSDSSESDEVDPEETNEVEEIPIEICEKLRHIHIYF